MDQISFDCDNFISSFSKRFQEQINYNFAEQKKKFMEKEHFVTVQNVNDKNFIGFTSVYFHYISSYPNAHILTNIILNGNHFEILFDCFNEYSYLLTIMYKYYYNNVLYCRVLWNGILSKSNIGIDEECDDKLQEELSDIFLYCIKNEDPTFCHPIFLPKPQCWISF